jgi:DNA-binding transcriptional LysR family regulator
VLLERTTRHVALTEVGRAYFERVRDALAGLDEATAAALDAAREPHGMVRVAVPPDIAPALAPLVARFLQAYPRIRIEVSASARAAELVGDHADLAIVVGRLPDSALVSRRVGDTVHQLHAAPSYLDARGCPHSLAELARHNAIAHSSGLDRWELTGPHGVELVSVAPLVAADHLGFVVEATLAGMGIALVPTFIVAAHVAAGRLVTVLPRYSTTVQLQLLTHASRRVPYRVALLRDFLAEHMSGACGKH